MIVLLIVFVIGKKKCLEAIRDMFYLLCMDYNQGRDRLACWDTQFFWWEDRSRGTSNTSWGF